MQQDPAHQEGSVSSSGKLPNEIGRFDTQAASFRHRFHDAANGIELDWNARNHRKLRSHPLRERDAAQRARHRYRWMALQWESLSWWVAAIFTGGSLIWLVNGLSILWPVAAWPVWSPQIPIWSALIGGLVFVIGAYLSWLEVLNSPRYVVLGRTDGQVHSQAAHASDDRFRWVGLHPPNWAWWWNLVQLSGAAIFFLSCTVGALLPHHPRINAFDWYWLPQMLGAVCFIFASWMAMRELQLNAWQPAWNQIGWWSGLFNLFGAIGFLMCALFGFQSRIENSGLSDITTLLGSICFLIGSGLLFIEVINPEGPEAQSAPITPGSAHRR